MHDNIGAAMFFWPKNGWRTKAGTAVLNQPDWERLVSLIRRVRQHHGLRVVFEWKKGKVGRHAKAVDLLAKKSSASTSFGRGRPVLVRRKKTTESVAVDSVRMEGQILRIRIVQAQHLAGRRSLTRYRYEVDDGESPYHGAVAWAESELTFAPGHTYRVRMNTIQRNPRIEEVIEEVVEDLTPYVDALTALGHPSAASDVAEQLKRTGASALPADAVRRRLELLVAEGRVQTARGKSRGRPFLYEPVVADSVAPAASGSTLVPSPKPQDAKAPHNSATIAGVDRDRDALQRTPGWVGVKPLSAPKQFEPETWHYTMDVGPEPVVTVCGQVLRDTVRLRGSDRPKGSRHAECERIAAGDR